MRKFLLSCFLLCATVFAVAQTEEHIDSIRKSKIDPLYLQFYAGVNKSGNENLPWTEMSRYPISGGVFWGIGKEVNPLLGWRAALRFNHNKSRNVPRCESPDTWGWFNLGLFADATLDLTDLARMGKETLPSRFNAKLFAGIGIGYTFGIDDVVLSYTAPYSRNSQVVAGLRAGLTATYRVNDNWRVGAELSQSFFSDMFNGVRDGARLDTRTNFKVGVTYICRRPKRKIKPIVPVRYDHRLRDIPELEYIMPQEEKEKVRQLRGRAFLDFPVNETVIYPNYRNNQMELKHIISTIDSALFDKSIQVRSISLHGYASPESPYSNNTRLSKGRAAALRDYLKRHYAFRDTIFSIYNTPEDWDNLRSFIAAGNRRRVKDDIWYEIRRVLETPEMPQEVLNYQAELLQVIDMQMDKDEKEILLKQVGNGEPYKWLLKHVYPGLRHTDYVIEYVVRQYPVKDGRRLIYTHPDALSLNEMCAVANSYPRGTDEWLDALLTAAKKFPDSYTANINAANACIEMHRLEDAKHYLNLCDSSSLQVRYAKDIIRAMEGQAEWRMENGRLILVNP